MIGFCIKALCLNYKDRFFFHTQNSTSKMFVFIWLMFVYRLYESLLNLRFGYIVAWLDMHEVSLILIYYGNLKLLISKQRHFRIQILLFVIATDFTAADKSLKDAIENGFKINLIRKKKETSFKFCSCGNHKVDKITDIQSMMYFNA